MRVWLENTEPCHRLQPEAVSEEVVSVGNRAGYNQWILNILQTLGHQEAESLLSHHLYVSWAHEQKPGTWPWTCSWGFSISLTGCQFLPFCNIILCGRLYQICRIWWQDWHCNPRAGREITLCLDWTLRKWQQLKIVNCSSFRHCFKWLLMWTCQLLSKPFYDKYCIHNSTSFTPWHTAVIIHLLMKSL